MACIPLFICIVKLCCPPLRDRRGRGARRRDERHQKVYRISLRLHEVASVDVLEVAGVISIQMESSRDRPGIECKSGEVRCGDCHGCFI